MQQTYFVDAWFFIALLEPRDAHHRSAQRLQRLAANATFVTHDGVLSEVLTYFADEGRHARLLAAKTVRNAMDDLHVESADRALFEAALDLYEGRPDKEYSLVDCMSMVVMEQRGIRNVLTNDHHFTQAGFTVVSE